MTNNIFPIDKLNKLETPFYYYNLELLKKTLSAVQAELNKYDYHQHYAVKANANSRILELIATKGFGADCVSGNEIKEAIKAGFPSSKIVFAGVGKTDKEISFALDNNIFCFNVESLPEILAINSLATKKGKKADIAIRVNPDVDAHTHEYITTGLSENKFGLAIEQLAGVIEAISSLKGINLVGLHFHIGSQIEDINVYVPLCEKINELYKSFQEKGIILKHINVGGGLGVDYLDPKENSIAPFESYFSLFHKHLALPKEVVVHFELGRAIVAQAGTLFSRVTYIKEGLSKKFAILDAGMTELIRPALYNAYHMIENLSSDLDVVKYDIVGPICESSDCFAKDYDLNETSRGDLIAIYTAGAYGEIMASQYNCRNLPKSYFSDQI